MDEKPCHIVLIDDDNVDRFVLRRSLQLVNVPCRITEVEKPEEAIALISNQEEEIDMVITDMQMPGMDGLQLIKAIRELPGLQLAPIVAITSYSSKYAEALTIL